MFYLGAAKNKAALTDNTKAHLLKEINYCCLSLRSVLWGMWCVIGHICSPAAAAAITANSPILVHFITGGSQAVYPDLKAGICTHTFILIIKHTHTDCARWKCSIISWCLVICDIMHVVKHVCRHVLRHTNSTIISCCLILSKKNSSRTGI